ncbi:protealysin inhibitor emfourin [Bradyrhizobium neotropicale]|uniref:protealysin inhibitor emfourin n=1 Tax=Bradyrhizobium neotropicale TaxID=1497615 RepID=UPI001AD7D260|nr:protealysin inhibitor emfourin [Bradyrhizobium neotropicale]MBO4224728.1 hypothetical protein [Bradyrhizobium neotropicale]
MKVILSQHGGQAAGIYSQRAPSVIDSAALDRAERLELDRLILEARTTPPRANSSKARDEMSYTITVQDAGHEIVLSESDTTMSEEFGKLLAWLQRYLRK